MKQKFDLQNKVNHKIDKILEKKNLKRKDLAKALGLTPSLISKLFSGQSRMSLSQLDTICTYLSVNISDLLYDSEKPDPSTYFYDEKEANLWCMSEISTYILILLVKRPMSESKLVDYFREKKETAKKELKILIENSLVLKRPDGMIAINPPTFTSYNVSKSKKFATRLSDILKALTEKLLNSGAEWEKKTISHSRTNINWFTDAQLYYMKEQIENMNDTLKDFLVENKRKNNRDAHQMQLISMESIQIMRES